VVVPLAAAATLTAVATLLAAVLLPRDGPPGEPEGPVDAGPVATGPAA